jgi:hypothetical protein
MRAVEFADQLQAVLDNNEEVAIGISIRGGTFHGITSRVGMEPGSFITAQRNIAQDIVDRIRTWEANH